nr:ATP-binding protein [Shewanella gelidii]
MEKWENAFTSGTLAALNSSNISTLASEFLRLQHEDIAKDIYRTAVDNDLIPRTSELDSLFSVSTESVKLRVVEKVDFESVTDLSRYRQATTNFSDVVGLHKIKKQISKKIILPLQKPSLFQRFKKKVGGGVLLFGPPGCGKTLLARATAGECNASFFNIEISDVLDMYIGESEQKLHAIFEKARAETPSVLFFDELEALAGKREHTRNSSSSNIISQFLTELDGFSQNNEGVLVLASTNVPWAIDPAFLRPGRFDRMFFVPPPDKDARAAILEHHMKERPVKGDISYPRFASQTSGYSGADLANLVEMAVDEAIDESITREVDIHIEDRHFKDALIESRPTTAEWLTTVRNYARYANDGGRYNDVLDFLKAHGK